MPSCGICLSHSCILSKSRQMFSNFFHYLEYPPFWFFQSKPYGNIPSNAGVVGKNHDCRRIAAGYGSMTAAVRTTTATVHRTVYGTDRHASVNFYLSPPCTTVTKRTERNNLAVRSIVAICKKRLRREIYETSVLF